MSGSHEEEPSFGDALRRYKQRGCSALITGNVPLEYLTPVSVRFLGSEPYARRRVLGTFDRGLDTAHERLRLAAPGKEPAVVVSTDHAARAKAAGGRSDRTQAVDLGVRWVDADLDGFQERLLDVIGGQKLDHGPFEPSELRVGVDSLGAIHDGAPRERVREFVTEINAEVRAARGMAHFVLPDAFHSDLAVDLRDEFEVVVEHHLIGERCEQRWRLPEHGKKSRWKPVS